MCMFCAHLRVFLPCLLPPQPPHTHPYRRRRFAPHPRRGAAAEADSFMDGCVGAGEAADAAETHVNVRKTCTCMHTLRTTSDPHGHHGRSIQNKIRIWSEYFPLDFPSDFPSDRPLDFPSAFPSGFYSEFPFGFSLGCSLGFSSGCAV